MTNINFQALGLTEQEYSQILHYLKREPTVTELYIYSVMWSEHCSYKNSKHLLSLLSFIQSKNVIAGIGANAGVIKINDHYITFKVESHNHPSYVSPYNGATTGVGGIIRDILAMGGNPIGIMDSLRFGLNDKSIHIAKEVIRGVADYSNCIGVPNIGGELYFDNKYEHNPLVNVFAIGELNNKPKKVKLKNDKFLVLLYGGKTGADGIGGASILASANTKESLDDMGSIQIGDPFTGKLLIDSTLSLINSGCVVYLQDLGAGGLSCALFELSSQYNLNIKLDINKVFLRNDYIAPELIMISESQERMCAIISEKDIDIFSDICDQHNIEFAIIGKANYVSQKNKKHAKVKGYFNNKKVFDLESKYVTDGVPIFKRNINKYNVVELDKTSRLLSEHKGIIVNQILKNICLLVLKQSRYYEKLITINQYDKYVQGNCIGDGVIRLDDNTNIICSIDGNGKYTSYDAYNGVLIACSEAYRNIVISGATPVGISDCLNFGSPYDTNVMKDLQYTIEGIAKFSNYMNIPVIGGNVSLYNQILNEAIYPTPIIAMVGNVSTANRVKYNSFEYEGDIIVLLGETFNELKGTIFESIYPGDYTFYPHALIEQEFNIYKFFNNCSKIITASHDLSEGGLFMGLCEMFLNGKCGAYIHDIFTDKVYEYLFSESVARVIISVHPEHKETIYKVANKYNVPITTLGFTIGKKLIFDNLCEFNRDDLLINTVI